MIKLHNTPQEQFAMESNRIEGEGSFTEGQLGAVFEAEKMAGCDSIFVLERILDWHNMSFEGKEWAGGWRDCQVYIGGHTPIPPEHIEVAMEEWIDKFPFMDAWEAHNSFEKIHPFQDGNGRLGRLIWLTKAISEGYYYEIPFLQMYYYQTLDHYENANKNQLTK